jgi:Epoxide hydrolase N terminus
LEDLRRRIAATNWPEKETVADQSQGVPLAAIQKLAHHWMTDYDWRAVEAQLKVIPRFMTEIDGLDIHFIHVRSKHEDALPLIVTHGWPGSIIEQPGRARFCRLKPGNRWYATLAYRHGL